MFERKNQGILSKHYNELVNHSQGNVTRNDVDEEDFIILKRIDHGLPQDGELPASNHLSRRKLKMGQSKRTMLKNEGQPTHLTFDDGGNPHKVYELKDVEDVFGEGGDAEIFEVGRRFLESERDKLKEADVWDKEAAKTKKNEKKRKDRDRDVLSFFSLSNDNGLIYFLQMHRATDEGLVSMEGGDEAVPPLKRQKKLW